MKVTCPSCNTHYRLDPNRVSSPTAKLRCAKCHNVFPLIGDPLEPMPVPLPSSPSPPVPLPGGEMSLGAPPDRATLGSAVPLPGAGPSQPTLRERPPQGTAEELTSKIPPRESLLSDLADFDFSDPPASAPAAASLDFGAGDDSADPQLGEQANEPSFDFAPGDTGEYSPASDLEFSALPPLALPPPDPLSDLPAARAQTNPELGGTMDFSDLPLPPPEPGNDLTVEIPAPRALPPDEALDFNFEMNPQ